MNRHVFLTALGTGPYQPVTYTPPPLRGEVDVTTEFIQEARVRALLAHVQLDAVYVLTTPFARSRHGDALEPRLAGFAPVVQLVPILNPTGLHAHWDVFRAVAQILEPGDRVYVDVTHGFRTLPLTLRAALDVLAVSRGVVVEEVTYGAYEAAREGPRPTWDLAILDDLSRWSQAMGALQETGDLRPLSRIVHVLYRRGVAAADGTVDAALLDLDRALTALGASLSVVHLHDLPVHTRQALAAAAALRTALGAADLPELAPLDLLLGALSAELRPLAGDPDELGAVWEAARWLADHRAWAPAMLLLREILAKHVVEDWQLGALAHAWNRGEDVPEALLAPLVERASRETDPEAWLQAFRAAVTAVTRVRNPLGHAWVGHEKEDVARLPERVQRCVELVRPLVGARPVQDPPAPRSTERSEPARLLCLCDVPVDLAEVSGGLEVVMAPDALAVEWRESANNRVIGKVLGWVRRAAEPGDRVVLHGDRGLEAKLRSALERMGQRVAYPVLGPGGVTELRDY